MRRPASLDHDGIKEIFSRSGALLEGHFLLSSGLHSGQYLQCALVLADPKRAERLGQALAKLQPEKPDLVVSPALGGLIIGHEAARALGVRAFFTEREHGAMTLRRGFSIKPGERVVVVEDVVTTGKSTGEVAAVLRAQGAEVTGALAIVDRSAEPPALDIPLRALLRLEVAACKPEDCPQCRAGISIMKPGSRTAPK